MRRRVGESRKRHWFLITANRWLITEIITVVSYILLVLLVTVGPSLIQKFLTTDAAGGVFTSVIIATVTSVTLVVTIDQLVLSQENGPLCGQRDSMENSMDFRDYAEELIGAPSPADPSAFLHELVDVAKQRENAVRDGLSKIDSDQLQWEVDEFTESVIGNSKKVREQLDGAKFGSFNVLFAALNYNYSWKIYQVEHLAHARAEDLGEPENSLLDELKTALSLFGPAREHVKTLYFEWALVSLSQMILYAAIPALVVAGVMLTVVEGATLPGSTFGMAHTTVVIGAAFTVTLVPFLLFTSYVLRIVTVAKRTLAIEPLILRDSQR